MTLPIDNPAVTVACFDIDGTLTTGGDFWQGLIHSSYVTAWQRRELYITAMPQYFMSKAGLLSQDKFRERWVRHMARLMKDWPKQHVDDVYEIIVNQYLLPVLRKDVVDILGQHRDHGHRIILVSTMFVPIVERMAACVQADIALGSVMEMRTGVCTGRIIGKTCSGANKVAFVQEYLNSQQPHTSLKQCAAYADSSSDIPFLRGMGFPIATYPDPAMRTAAQEHGWTIYPSNE